MAARGARTPASVVSLAARRQGGASQSATSERPEGMRRRGGEAMSPTWARGSVPSEMLIGRLPPGPGSEPGRPALRRSCVGLRSGETPSRPQPPRSERP